MRHRPLERALAALLLLWFGLVTAEPATLHACPVHWPTPARIDGTAGTHDGHDVVVPARTRPAPDHGGDRHECACVGDCASVRSASGLPAARVVVVEARVRRLRVAPPRAEAPFVASPAFLLPYANGPPAGDPIA